MKEYNYAGKTLVVDRIKQLKGDRSRYIRTVAKTAQNSKNVKTFHIESSSSTIERNDRSLESQTIFLEAVIKGYENAVPMFEITNSHRMCGYSSGNTKSTVVSLLQNLIDNETPYNPTFSGTDNWSRGGEAFEAGDVVSIVYSCTDGTYITALMTVSAVGDSSLTGVVSSYSETFEGFDDKEIGHVTLHIPYAHAQALGVALYNKTATMDTIQLGVLNATPAPVQMLTVNTYADLPIHVNRSSIDADFGDNLVKGDYILVKFVTLTAKTSTTAEDEAGKIWNISDLSSYYDSNLDPITVSSFVVDSVYYAFAIYGWTYNDTQWFREMSSGNEASTAKEAVSLAKAQHQIDSTIDYHEALYAHKAYIDSLSVGVINAGDIFANDITSNNYTEDANGTPTTGYKLVHNGGDNGDGEIKSVGGTYADMNVRGSLRLWRNNNVDEVGADIEHPALTTVSETIAEDPTGVTVANSPVAWYGNSLLTAVNAITRNSINTATGTFGSKTLFRYVYATDLNTTIRNAETYQKTNISPSSSFSTSFTVPDYVKSAKTLSVSGNPSGYIGISVYGQAGAGAVTIKVNNVTVFSKADSRYAPVDFSTSFSVLGGDVVSFTYASPTHGSGSVNTKSGVLKYTFPKIAISDYVSSVGFWFEYSDGTMEEIGSNTSYSDRLQMSAPVSFDSDSYKVLNNCANFLSYWSFIDAYNVSHTLRSGITYKITSTGLYVLGNAVTGKYITRNASSVVIIYEYNGTRFSIEITSGNYYQSYGTIKIAQTDTKGVKMMGNYPKRDADDPDGGFDCGNSGYVWDNGYFKTLHYSNINQGSALALKENILPFAKNALEIINQTSIVNYNYKKDKDKAQKIGFIADYTPTELAGEKHDRMELDHCVAVLIKAVQELSAEIEKLKAESKNNH